MKRSAVILAGGLSTRFNDLGDKPKCLLELHGKPILHWLVTFLIRENFEVILSLGHLSEEIIYFCKSNKLDVKYVIEPKPLGTAGAIRYALEEVEDENFMVLNADTINNYSKIGEAFKEHRNKNNLITHVVASQSNQNEGKIIVEGKRVVENFEGKDLKEIPLKPDQEAFSSTGVYVINRKYFSKQVELIPDDPVSLETIILPEQTKNGLVYSYDLKSDNRDLGTLDRYRTFLKDYSHDDVKIMFGED